MPSPELRPVPHNPNAQPGTGPSSAIPGRIPTIPSRPGEYRPAPTHRNVSGTPEISGRPGAVPDRSARPSSSSKPSPSKDLGLTPEAPTVAPHRHTTDSESGAKVVYELPSFASWYTQAEPGFKDRVDAVERGDPDPGPKGATPASADGVPVRRASPAEPPREHSADVEAKPVSSRPLAAVEAGQPEPGRESAATAARNDAGQPAPPGGKNTAVATSTAEVSGSEPVRSVAPAEAAPNVSDLQPQRAAGVGDETKSSSSSTGEVVSPPATQAGGGRNLGPTDPPDAPDRGTTGEFPERFIGGPTGGIPASIFTPGTHEVQGASGRTTLTCTVTPTEITIQDTAHPEIRFQGRILPSQPDLVEFISNNKGWQGDLEAKHPDIYTRGLIEESITFFRQQGNEVNGIEALLVHLPGGRMEDIYRQYAANLEAIHDRPVTEDDRKDAARNTWIGAVAAAQGFTEVTKAEEPISGPEVKTVAITFRKPQP